MTTTMEPGDLPVPAEPHPVRLAGTLALAGLLSGLALAIAYDWTLPMIEHNRAEALRRAVFEVVPGAAAMQPLTPGEDGLAHAGDGTAADQIVYGAYTADGEFLGYAIPAEGNGFQDAIKLIYGYDPARQRVIGMRVLESRETPGLGDKIFKDAQFVANFDDLAVEPAVVVVKHGEKTQDHQVDAITGATISSKAVGAIVQGSMSAWRERLPAAGAAPELVRER